MKKIDRQKIIQNFIIKARKLKPKNQEDLEKLKRTHLGKKMGVISNSQILDVYKSTKNKEKWPPSKNLENLLRKRKIRTLSGVATVAIFVKPNPCPGHCLYCPTQPKMPKSYLSNEPAVMRAILCHFDPKKQIWARLKTLEDLGHPTDKIELIVMGGTFSVLPRPYQLRFITNCFEICNKIKNKKTKTKITNQRPQNLLEKLKIAQQKNETAKYRIVGLTLETRPDFINEEEIKWMRELGATRVELGVQSIYDDVLKFNRRGHPVSKTIQATKLLKDGGFKINYHLMPNLPKSNTARDLKMFKELFKNPDFQPDMLKIYPCVLTKNAPMFKKIWQEKKYKPYSDRRLINLLIKIKQAVPHYVRIMRLGRDIPAKNILSGSKISNVREVVADEMKKKNLKCRCIRCREIKNNVLSIKHFVLNRKDYLASGGKEIFLSFEDQKNDKLIAFLRLRVSSMHFSRQKHFMTELQNAALIREIHTYGQMVPVGERMKKAFQHFGFGKKLVKEAERIAKKEFNLKKIAAIAGVGVRNFWRKSGYRLKNTYMMKWL